MNIGVLVKGLVVVGFVLLSSSSFALPAEQPQVMNPTQETALAIAPPSPVFFSLASDTITPPSPANDVAGPSFRKQDTVSQSKTIPRSRLRVTPPQASGGSLTVQEMKLVMNGGRNWDFVSKRWSYRYAWSGEKRNNFLLSWEAHRQRSHVNQGIPSEELYSK